MNRSVTLDQLPAPPDGKTGWPWTEASTPLPANLPNGSPWPRISVVTPSYNQGQFLEETLRSILLQGYPNLEYIVIDGGSRDESVEIIQRYAPYLSHWVSEPDRGQSHALNKGIEQATGQFFTFVNSDDCLTANALARVADYFIRYPATAFLSGGVVQVDHNGKLLREISGFPAFTWEDLVMTRTYLPQLGTFWRTENFEVVGKFRQDLHFFFDQEFFIRMLMNYSMTTIDGVFAIARFHSAAKSYSSNLSYSREKHDVLLNFLPKVQENPFAKWIAYRLIKLSYLLDRVAMDQHSNLWRKVMFLLKTPIVWTSPTCIRRVLLGDNQHAPIRGING